jgi:hypothetical protein
MKVWNHLKPSFEHPPTMSIEKQQQRTSSLPQAKSQDDQRNQRTTSMELPLMGHERIDSIQERPSPFQENRDEEDRIVAKEYQLLPLSLKGFTSTNSTLAPREPPNEGNEGNRQDGLYADYTNKTSSRAPVDQPQDGKNENTCQGDLSFMTVSVHVKPSMIPPYVGNAIKSLADMWGELGSSVNSFFTNPTSQVGKSHVTVQTSPLSTPFPTENSPTNMRPFRPVPAKGNTLPIVGVRPDDMSMIPSLFDRDSTPTNKAELPMVAAPVQHQSGQDSLLSKSPAVSSRGAFAAILPMDQSDDSQKGEISDLLLVTQDKVPSSSSVATTTPTCSDMPFTVVQSLRQPPPPGLPNDDSHDPKAPVVQVESGGNNPLTKSMSRRLGLIGTGIGRSMAKGVRRTFGGRTKKPRGGDHGSTTMSRPFHSTM